VGAVQDSVRRDAGIGLAVAHPGHELRLSRWIQAARPTVFILTTGSRNGEDRSRVEASQSLAARLGATAGGVFGRHLDRDVYAWIMAGDPCPFTDLAAELADHFVRQDLRMVVTDSWQLYNAVHDLWHLTVRAAAAEASSRLGRLVECVDYRVVPDQMSGRSAGVARLQSELSPAEVDDKLRLAAEFPAITDDVAELVRAGGRGFLASETLHEPRPVAELVPAPGEKPLYERYGEARVAAGLYGSVLRWAHVEPIAAELGAMLERLEPAA